MVDNNTEPLLCWKCGYEIDAFYPSDGNAYPTLPMKYAHAVCPATPIVKMSREELSGATNPILCCKCSQEIDTSGTYVQRYLGDGKNGYEHTKCPIVGYIPVSEMGYDLDYDAFRRWTQAGAGHYVALLNRNQSLEREKTLLHENVEGLEGKIRWMEARLKEGNETAEECINLHKRVEELESQSRFRDDLERRMVEQRGTVHVLTAEYESLKADAEKYRALTHME